MKAKLIFLAAATAIVVFSCKNKPAKSEATVPVRVSETPAPVVSEYHKYGIKSGIVTFETAMMGMKIKSVLYFDDYGQKEADEKYSGDHIKSIDICTGKERFVLKPDTKTALSNGECTQGVSYRFSWDEVSKADPSYKPEKLPNMTVAGKDCESFSIEHASEVTVYAGWQNICLYLKTPAAGSFVIKQAVSIEENVQIPAEKFQVPSDYQVKKMGEL